MIEIVQKGNDVLRQIAPPVPIDGIATPHTQKVITNMREAMHSQHDAVAIAAPQINVSLRIFIVSGKVFDTEEERANKDHTGHADMVFINPEIVKLSKKTAEMEEGCLSVRWWYGEVKRSQNATIKAYDEHGHEFTRGAGGLLAQIFQHETDHLNGKLFDDTAKNLREIDPEDDLPEE